MTYENKFFRMIKDINKIVCLECDKTLSGINVSNIKRHYKLIHKKDISEKQNNECGDECIPAKKRRTDEVVRINIDKSQFLKCCVGLVAVKNLPFRIFDDSEFFKVLISPYEEKFNTSLNSKNITDVLQDSCAKIQEIVANRVKNKMVSLKFDIASRMDKSILGINIQYIKDFKIYINTIGMTRLQKRHRASYLKEEILGCLNTYQIEIGQIYSSTTDNGANMLKVSQILQEIQEEQIGEEKSNGENSTSEDNDDSIHKILSSVLSVVRCAAHTIQLSAYDVLKNLAQEINECRDAVKQLRKKIRSGDIQMQMPSLDNTTRWNSTYEMFVSLLEVSQNIELLYMKKNSIPDINWDFVKNFVAAFKPLALCTKQLQKEQYIIGDFYRDWLCCEIELEEIFAVTPYASLLHNSMQIRKQLLFKNDAFLAALYLDPRFNFENSNILCEQQRTTAIEHLVKSFDVLIGLQNDQTRRQSESSCDIQTELPTTSAFAKLEQRIMESITNISANAQTHRTFKQKLMLLMNQKKLPLDTDVLSYWKTTDDSDIKKIVEVALGVPATQVSVERAFSALPLVLTKLRSNLNNKTLSNLLITKLNFQELNARNIEFS